MGQRNQYETVAGVLVAFAERRTWRQSELAAKLGISSRRMRVLLCALEGAGVPFERQTDHPYVYWSVPQGWLPGAVRLSEGDVRGLLDLLWRLPPSQLRERCLEALTPGVPEVASNPGIGHHGTPGLEMDDVWKVVREALRDQQPLRMRYRSASSATRSRLVSPQRIETGKAVHLIAVCHESNELKRFRFDRIERVDLASFEEHRMADVEAIRRIVDEAVDGYRAPKSARRLSFIVASECAPWVAGDLPLGLRGELLDDGRLHVVGYVAGLQQVARYVVGLGDGVEIESVELREATIEIAQRALANHSADASLCRCSAGSNGSPD